MPIGIYIATDGSRKHTYLIYETCALALLSNIAVVLDPFIMNYVIITITTITIFDNNASVRDVKCVTFMTNRQRFEKKMLH